MGKTRNLNSEKILKKAVYLADREGLEKLSMRKLAKALGIEAMSLYNHVESKDDLLDKMADLFYSKIQFDHTSKDWVASMKERAHSIRSLLKRHRWALSLLNSRENPGFASLNHHDQVISCLLNSGFSLEQVGHAYSLLDAYIFGFAIQDQNLPFENDNEIEALATKIVETFPEGHLNAFRNFTLNYVLQPGYSFDREFEIGLNATIEGVKTLLN